MIKRAPLIVWITVVALGAVWWFFGMSPLMQARTDYKEQIETLTKQETSLQEELNRLRSYQEGEVETQSKLMRLATLIPEGLNQQALFNSYQSIMDQAGVTIVNLNFSTANPVEAAPASPYEGKVLAQTGVDLTVTGGYFQILDFLRRLEMDMGRANLVDNITLSRGAETGGVLEMSLNMSARVFLYIADPAAQAPADSESNAEASEEGTTEDKETTDE